MKVQHKHHNARPLLLNPLLRSVPVFDEAVPAACCHLAALHRVPRYADAHAVMRLDGTHHLIRLRPLPEERTTLRVTCC
jgi:hypothetical protein